MQIRDLVLADAQDLLAFEVENRNWFEQYVTPRDDRFYTSVGVEDHIRAYLIARQQQRFHGCVVVNDAGKIIARANLREINMKRHSAEVGYRVGQAYTGLGVASEATRYLIQLAYGEWQIQDLRGFVSVQNPASSRVLEKNGFVRIGFHPRMSLQKQGRFDCIEYRHVPI